MLIYNCVMLGDISPLANVLTEADSIFLEAVLRDKHKLESEHHYVMLDVRFFLHRLAGAFTGSEGMNFLPSAVHEMEERLSGED